MITLTESRLSLVILGAVLLGAMLVLIGLMVRRAAARTLRGAAAKLRSRAGRLEGKPGRLTPAQLAQQMVAAERAAAAAPAERLQWVPIAEAVPGTHRILRVVDQHVFQGFPLKAEEGEDGRAFAAAWNIAKNGEEPGHFSCWSGADCRGEVTR